MEMTGKSVEKKMENLDKRSTGIEFRPYDKMLNLGKGTLDLF